uniref:Uncharacterized protein n=1 Tax=Anguilla anguilla TaxID=7936 RepID=A0A0E9Q268_ANGAN
MNIVNWNAFVHLLFVNQKTIFIFLKMPQSVGVYVFSLSLSASSNSHCPGTTFSVMS